MSCLFRCINETAAWQYTLSSIKVKLCDLKVEGCRGSVLELTGSWSQKSGLWLLATVECFHTFSLFTKVCCKKYYCSCSNLFSWIQTYLLVFLCFVIHAAI